MVLVIEDACFQSDFDRGKLNGLIEEGNGKKSYRFTECQGRRGEIVLQLRVVTMYYDTIGLILMSLVN